MPVPTLGKIIKRSEAEAEIRTYLDIRKETYSKIVDTVNKIDPPIPAARIYFSDKEISFVFDQVSILSALAMGGPNCNGLRVYYAAAPRDEADPVRTKGSTTVVIVPCKIDYADFKISNIVPDSGDDNAGIEYPGGIIREIDNVEINLRDDDATEVSHIFSI